MGKGRDAKKTIKKPPTKTAKEKRAEKKLKKANRDQQLTPYEETVMIRRLTILLLIVVDLSVNSFRCGEPDKLNKEI